MDLYLVRLSRKKTALNLPIRAGSQGGTMAGPDNEAHVLQNSGIVLLSTNQQLTPLAE